MSLYSLGLNHTTAPVHVRERVVFEAASLGTALAELGQMPGVHEAAIVSTCNRTEIYCAVDSPTERHSQIVAWFHRWHGDTPEQVEACLYHYAHDAAVRHLMRVACGLDSLVLGEPQITGQLKSAWRAATDAGMLGVELGRLFQHAFAVSKAVRTDTGIGTSPVSVAFAAVTLARQIFGDLGPRKALMIGAGETVELAARHLRGAGLEQLIVANRDAHRAARLAGQHDGEGIALSSLPERLHEADIVVSSTASSLPILGKGAVEQALRRRRYQPMFMVDIAVPRDIEPEIGRLDEIFLYTVDDLHNVIEEGMAARREAAAEAESIIEREVATYTAWQRSLDAVDAIRNYRSRAEALSAQTLAEARRELERSGDPDAALAFLARRLTRRLTHKPTVALRRAGREGRQTFLADARELLDLDESDP